MLFSWLVNTRQDASCPAKRMAQAKSLIHERAKIKTLNTIKKKIKNSISMGLKFKPIDEKTLSLRIYINASFFTKIGLYSQLSCLILLCKKVIVASFIDYPNKKFKRVVRSVIAAEVYAFMDGFDINLSTAKNLELILQTNLKIILFTDSK